MAWPSSTPAGDPEVSQPEQAIDPLSGLNGLDLLSSDYAADLWDMTSVPFAGILGPPEWDASQYVTNTIDMANPLWGYWPPGDTTNVSGVEATTTSSVPASVNPCSDLAAGSSTVRPTFIRDSLSQSSIGQDSLLRPVCDVLRGSPWKEIPLKDLPSMHQMEHFVDQYFAKVHTVGLAMSGPRSR